MNIWGTHYSAVLLINQSQMNLYHLDLKSSMLPLEREGGKLVSGKENPLHWCEGRFACRSLGKTWIRERDHFHFKEPLVISQCSWLIGSFTGKGKRAAALTGSLMAAVIVGTNIVGNWHCQRAKSACVISRKGRGSVSVGPIKGLKEWEQMRKTRGHKKTEPPWTLLVNGARLFQFTSAFCSIAKLSHVVKTVLSALWQSKVFVASVNLYSFAPVFHLCLPKRRRRGELSIRRTYSPRDAPTHSKLCTRATTPARPRHVTSNVTKTHRYISPSCRHLRFKCVTNYITTFMDGLWIKARPVNVLANVAPCMIFMMWFTPRHTPHIIGLVMCASAKELVNNRVPAGLC